jgi:hypothetical protein
MFQTAKMVLIFIFAVMSCTVHGSLKITSSDYSLMQYTRIISEEHFSAGRPLVIVMPLAVKESTSDEVDYLIEELHTAGRWPILVYNISNCINRNTYTEIDKPEAYIVIISEPCEQWTEFISRFQQQLYELSAGITTTPSWNPTAKFVVSVMSNCRQKKNTEFSRDILNELWLNDVMKATVLFLVSNEHEIRDLKGNTIGSVYGTYLEMHSWLPFENSERCHSTEGPVLVKVVKARNFSDIKKSDIFQKNYDKNFHKCPIRVNVNEVPPFVYPSTHVENKDSGYQNVYKGGWDIELLRVVANALNMSLDFVVGNEEENSPAIYVGGYAGFPNTKIGLKDTTCSYLTENFVWYTPCSLKYPKWSRFFHIFSVNTWICFTLSLILAVITVSCISNYGHRSESNQSSSYSNISSATSNIIAVSLSVSVNRQPRSAPLRLFFFCWVFYSVAISTVFQAHLTTFLIEPGYVEPIKTVEQMLNYGKGFGFEKWYYNLFSNSSESFNSEILKKAVLCPDECTCFNWAALYHNFSTILDDIPVQTFRAIGKWSDENNKPLLCALEDGVVTAHRYVFLVRNGKNFLELINDVIVRLVEGGIFTHIQKRYFDKQEIQSKFNSLTFPDTYAAINISHLQTVFYILLLGYVLAFASFVTEIMWHRCRAKRREPNSTSVCQERT